MPFFVVIVAVVATAATATAAATATIASTRQFFSAPILGTFVGLDDVEKGKPPGGHARKKHRVGSQVGRHHAELDKALAHIPDAQAGDLALDASLARLGPVEHKVEGSVDAVTPFERPQPPLAIDRRPRVVKVCRRHVKKST